MMDTPRMLIIAQPPAAVRQPMRKALLSHNLHEQLGERLFPEHNWHQTLCGPYPASNAAERALARAGNAACATQTPAFRLRLNRIRGPHMPAGERMHWSFMSQGRPTGFDVLRERLQAQVQPDLLPDTGHTPHVTICYRAPAPLATQFIQPIDWQIRQILLVVRRGTGNGWRYEALQRWELPAMPDDDCQLELFDPQQSASGN